ncbi:hypothetical protein [Sinorhizobium fredii]|uniref:hypothetical protein n=1 Tax=Rhizobium fredii TaxID=380 RepID=UPI001F483FF9|nr:hypothetical protein [Sinorhizobium fredii]
MRKTSACEDNASVSKIEVAANSRDKGLQVVEDSASQAGLDAFEQRMSALDIKEELRQRVIFSQVAGQAGVANLNDVAGLPLFLRHCHQSLPQVAYRQKAELFLNDL